MKTTFNSIKTILKPILRKTPPPYDPLTELELADLENSLKNKEQKKLNKKESILVDNNNIFEKVKDMNQIIEKIPKLQSGLITKNENILIERAYRRIYDILIEERDNKNSFTLSYLSEKFSFDAHIILQALKKLEKQHIIKLKNNGLISLNQLPSQSKGTNYNIYIEKILPGKAYVLVNGKWYALLNYYDYDGPRNLLKKGSEFKAIAELYRNGSEFCIRIKEITF